MLNQASSLLHSYMALPVSRQLTGPKGENVNRLGPSVGSDKTCTSAEYACPPLLSFPASRYAYLASFLVDESLSHHLRHGGVRDEREGRGAALANGCG